MATSKQAQATSLAAKSPADFATAISLSGGEATVSAALAAFNRVVGADLGADGRVLAMAAALKATGDASLPTFASALVALGPIGHLAAIIVVPNIGVATLGKIASALAKADLNAILAPKGTSTPTPTVMSDVAQTTVSTATSSPGSVAPQRQGIGSQSSLIGDDVTVDIAPAPTPVATPTPETGTAPAAESKEVQPEVVKSPSTDTQGGLNTAEGETGTAKAVESPLAGDVADTSTRKLSLESNAVSETDVQRLPIGSAGGVIANEGPQSNAEAGQLDQTVTTGSTAAQTPVAIEGLAASGTLNGVEVEVQIKGAGEGEIDAPAQPTLEEQVEDLKKQVAELKKSIDEILSKLQATEATSAGASMTVDDLAVSVGDQLASASEGLATRAPGLRLGRVTVTLKATPGAGADSKLRVAAPRNGQDSATEIVLDYLPGGVAAAMATASAVPDVRGYSEQLARRKLAAAGFLAEVQYQIVGDAADTQIGRVLAQSPATAVEGSVITLFLGRADTAGTAEAPETPKVSVVVAPPEVATVAPTSPSASTYSPPPSVRFKTTLTGSAPLSDTAEVVADPFPRVPGRCLCVDAGWNSLHTGALDHMGSETIELWVRLGRLVEDRVDLFNAGTGYEGILSVLADLSLSFTVADAHGDATVRSPEGFRLATDTWTHVAVVVDREAGEVRFYLDGVAWPDASSAPFVAGIRRWSDLGWRTPYLAGHQGARLDGLVRDIRLWSVARTQAQIYDALARDPTDAERTDLLAWYPLDDGAGGVLTDHSGNGRDGGMVNGRWVDAPTLPDLRSLWEIPGDKEAGTPSLVRLQTAIRASIANGGMAATDWREDRYLHEDGSTFAVGTVEGALTFDGVDDSLVLPPSVYRTLQGSFTVSAWLRVAEIGRQQFIFGLGDTRSALADTYLYLYAQEDGTVAWWMRPNRGEGGTMWVASQATLATGRWVHVAGVREIGDTAHGWRLYLNGTLEASAPDVIRPFDLGIWADKRVACVGCIPPEVAGASEFLHGELRGLEIASRALRATEIAARAKEGVA